MNNNEAKEFVLRVVNGKLNQPTFEEVWNKAFIKLEYKLNKQNLSIKNLSAYR